MAEASPVYAVSPNDSALLQCELLSDVAQYVVQSQADREGTMSVAFKRVLHPLAVVLSQDCDLERDFIARRKNATTPDAKNTIPNVLLCEAQIATEVRNPGDFDSKLWKRITENREERFQYLGSVPGTADAKGLGFDAILIDFRKNFTVPTHNLYSQFQESAQRRTVLQSPYLEHLSQRYARYLSRIALPIGHHEAGLPSF